MKMMFKNNIINNMKYKKNNTKIQEITQKMR